MDADGIAVVVAMLHAEGVREIMHPNGPGGPPFKNISAAVFTPNAPEFWRLCDACEITHANVQPHDDSALVQVWCKLGNNNNKRFSSSLRVAL